MKKFISKVFVVLVLVLSVVSGLFSNFTAKVNAQDKVTINFINGFTGGDGAFMKKITDGFNASQDKYVINEVQEADHYTKFTTGDFDLVVMHATNIATFKADGLIFMLRSDTRKMSLFSVTKLVCFYNNS